MKILITGGAGFVGSHLTDRLLSQGNQVIILDNFSSGFRENVNPDAIVVEGDVRNQDTLEFGAKRVLGNVDVIYHLAEYIPNVAGHVIQHSVKNPRADLDVSVGGTINALETVRKTDARFIFTSTAATYGQHEIPVNELTPTKPISPYGLNKLCCELYVDLYARTYGLKTTVYRLFNVYGPRQRKYLMYDTLCKLRNCPARLDMMGDGYDLRDYIYVDNAVDMLISPFSGLKNVGTGIGTFTTDVVSKIYFLREAQPEIHYSGPWKGNIQAVVASNSCLPLPIRLEDGLKRVVKWFDST